KLAGPGGWTLGALRLCAGARIVSGVAFDPELGATPEQRLEREIADARLVIEKIEVIVRYWKALEKFEAEPPGDHRV
ncbi:MAG: hypothetical protein OEM59_14500, partial [Rhodospirillales bacterium]|nr:hypothetical protein [Rhodospirillales bacterium]